MKKFVLLFLLCSANLAAQDTLLGVLPLVSGEISYIQVHEVIGFPKDSLVENAKEWYLMNKAVKVKEIELDEKHQAVTGSLSFKTLWGPNDFPELYKEVQFNLQVLAKNERYQYHFSNFAVIEPGIKTQLAIYKSEKNSYEKYNRDFYTRIDDEINKMINSLIEKMKEE